MLRNGRVRRDGGTARPTVLAQAASGSESARLSGCLRWWACGVKADSGAMGLWRCLRPLGCLASEGLRPLCALCAESGWGLAHGARGVTWYTLGDHQRVPEAKGGTQTHALNEKGGILGAAMPKAVVFKLSTPSAHLVRPVCYAMGFRYRILPGPQLDAESMVHCALRLVGWSGVDNLDRERCTYNPYSSIS